MTAATVDGGGATIDSPASAPGAKPRRVSRSRKRVRAAWRRESTVPTGQRNDQRNEPRLIVDVSLEKKVLIKKYNAAAQLLIANLFADDFMTVGNFINDRRFAVRDFGRQFEIRFRLNF